MSHHHIIRSSTISTLALLLALGVGACADGESPSDPTDAPTAVFGHGQPTDAAVNADLAAARQVMAHLQQFGNAVAAGWDLPVGACVENQPLGGMGYHHGNLEYYFDGEANPREPDILVYEPQPNGRLRLVALEYAIPFVAWSGELDVDDPPQIFGRDMNRADAREQWELHVWLGKHNPSGLFADWNPTVTCEHA